jgi:hypothetical protein
MHFSRSMHFPAVCIFPQYVFSWKCVCINLRWWYWQYRISSDVSRDYIKART